MGEDRSSVCPKNKTVGQVRVYVKGLAGCSHGRHAPGHQTYPIFNTPEGAQLYSRERETPDEDSYGQNS